jgi:glutamyl/glutaminyl-tRNA synthetase
MCDALRIRKPYIWDFSRLNFTYTLLSKRRLQWFVDNNRVDGWYDPRFPTIQGVLRRGMTIEALRDFILEQGASKNMTYQTWDKVWSTNNSRLDLKAPRYTAVSVENRVLFKLTNFPHDTVEICTVPLHPKYPNGAQKVVTKSASLIVEQDDAALLDKDEEITLMGWCNAIVKKITKQGKTITSIEAELNPEGDYTKTKRKLHWLALGPNSQYGDIAVSDKKDAPSGGSSANNSGSNKKQSKSENKDQKDNKGKGNKGKDASSNSNSASGEEIELNVGDEDLVPIQLVEFDYLITKDKLTEEDEKTFEKFINPKTKYQTSAAGEGSLRNIKRGDIVQLQRRGFYICDRVFFSPKKPLVLIAIPSGKQNTMSVVGSKVPVKVTPKDTGTH